jgi:hypothetical protein
MRGIASARCRASCPAPPSFPSPSIGAANGTIRAIAGKKVDFQFSYKIFREENSLLSEFARSQREGRMACSAIYFLDMKGKVLISRNYRGDIDNSVIDKFIGEILDFPLFYYTYQFASYYHSSSLTYEYL